MTQAPRLAATKITGGTFWFKKLKPWFAKVVPAIKGGSRLLALDVADAAMMKGAADAGNDVIQVKCCGLADLGEATILASLHSSLGDLPSQATC